jgi:hypothetical protein
MKRTLLLLACAAFVCLAMCGMGGCVERKMTITSDPPGALVRVSDVEVGRTPVTVDFTWYGDYELIFRMEGYKTLITHATFTPPWYEVPPIDLLSETAPWTYHDLRYLNFKLEKLAPLTDEEIIKRADELKKKALEPTQR